MLNWKFAKIMVCESLLSNQQSRITYQNECHGNLAFVPVEDIFY